MLLCVRDRGASPRTAPSLTRQFSHHDNEHDTTRVSHFLPTSRRIVQFSNGKVRPAPRPVEGGIWGPLAPPVWPTSQSCSLSLLE